MIDRFERVGKFDAAGLEVARPDLVYQELSEQIEGLYRMLADADETIELLRWECEKARKEVERSRREAWWRFSHFEWKEYDLAYSTWKSYRKKIVKKDEAWKTIEHVYGLRSFFLLYPLYKITKPFRKIRIFMARRKEALCAGQLVLDLTYKPRPHKVAHAPAGVMRRVPLVAEALAPRLGEGGLRLKLYNIKNELSKSVRRAGKHHE